MDEVERVGGEDDRAARRPVQPAQLAVRREAGPSGDEPAEQGASAVDDAAGPADGDDMRLGAHDPEPGFSSGFHSFG